MLGFDFFFYDGSCIIVIFFVSSCHCFNITSFERWDMGVICFFFRAIFLFCYILATTKVHGGKKIMPTAFSLLTLPILWRSGLQGDAAQDQATITCALGTCGMLCCLQWHRDMLIRFLAGLLFFFK